MPLQLTTYEDMLELAGSLSTQGTFIQIDAHQVGPVVTGVIKHWTSAWTGPAMSITFGVASVLTAPTGGDLPIAVFLNSVPQVALTIADGETQSTPGDDIPDPIPIVYGDVVTISVVSAFDAADLAVALLLTGFGGQGE